MNLLIPQKLSFSKSLSATTPQLHFLPATTITTPPGPRPTIIRMGGGPRTYPGGVSKWQWKRMQAKKAKQLLKARLCRERQIYEMRKRAELRAAVSELERPWEPVEQAPTLFSVRADEQVKVLADRFQKPGGFDLWSEKDGPQLFATPDELPSARFFPKGVVHSVRPYRKISADELLEDGDDGHGEGFSSDSRFLSEGIGDGSDDGESSSATLSSRGNNGVSVGGGSRKNGRKFLSQNAVDGRFSSSTSDYGRNGVNATGRMRKNENGRRFLPENADDGRSSSSPLDYGRNGVYANGRMRKKGNGRSFLSKNVGNESDNGELSSSSSLTYGRNGGSYDGRMRRSGNGRRYLSKDVDDGSNDGVCSSPNLSSEKNGGNVGGRMKKNQDGRRYMSNGVNRSNEFYSERTGSGRKHGGKYSGADRSGGKYSRGTSGYASKRVRDAGSEVYDMDLYQDGSYGFRQKSEVKVWTQSGHSR